MVKSTITKLNSSTCLNSVNVCFLYLELILTHFVPLVRDVLGPGWKRQECQRMSVAGADLLVKLYTSLWCMCVNYTPVKRTMYARV